MASSIHDHRLASLDSILFQVHNIAPITKFCKKIKFFIHTQLFMCRNFINEMYIQSLHRWNTRETFCSRTDTGGKLDDLVPMVDNTAYTAKKERNIVNTNFCNIFILHK